MSVKKISSFDAPLFFLNINAKGELGHSLIMLIKKCKTKDEVNTFIEEDKQISLEYSKESSQNMLLLNIYENEQIADTIAIKKMFQGKYYLGIVPLIDIIWEQDEKTQGEQIQYAKNSLLAQHMTRESIANVDITMLEIVLEEYSKEIERYKGRIKYAFVPLQKHELFLHRRVVKR